MSNPDMTEARSLSISRCQIYMDSYRTPLHARTHARSDQIFGNRNWEISQPTTCAFNALHLWPNWRSVWDDSYLLEEDILLSDLSTGFYFQPFCSSIMQSPVNVLLDEVDAINLDDEVLSYWDEYHEMEEPVMVTKVEENEKSLPLVCYGAAHGATANSSWIKSADDGVRSEEKELTFELVSRYFYMPITQAARELDVGLTLLKKKCRELGIPRWPHRKMKSLQTLINNVQVLQEEGGEEEELRAVVEMLQEERRLLEQKPYVQLEEKTKRLRQACFKANYKKRRLLALEAGDAST